jgi:hypothetical protein
MSEPSLFVGLSSRRIAELVRRATKHVCYAAPGIQAEVSAALVELNQHSPAVTITVNLDFSETTLRLGYGSLEAVEQLRINGIEPVHFAGFRSSVLLVDEAGWVFTPTALYLEQEPHSDETPNAVRLSTPQAREMLMLLCPPARAAAISQAATSEEAQQIASVPLAVSTQRIEEAHFTEVKGAITQAPPVRFDLARQVRVFEPYLQYVELSLTGAAIERGRVRIPRSVQRLGSSGDLEGRLQTTFDLIEKRKSLSSNALEEELMEIRKMAPTLGKRHGRVVLKATKPRFEERLDEFRVKLVKHQERIREELQKCLDESKEEIIEHFLPLAKLRPPDELTSQMFGPPTDDDIRHWLCLQMDGVVPSAEKLVSKMVLEVHYKDVTFETLNRDDFFDSVKRAFPLVNWSKTYDEFKAAGEVNDLFP